MSIWGIFTAAGAVTAVLWLLHHHRRLGLSQNEFWAAIWTLLIGGIIGAKALFLILGWEHYAKGELRFWADFDIGFIFLGGLAGAILAGYIFARAKGMSFMKGADYFAVAIPVGHAIGRIGCFLNGCCPGRPPHPVQLYESAGLVMIALMCRGLLTRIEANKAKTGTAFRCYLIMYCLLRILLDPLRADGRPERFLGLSHQQLIAMLIVIMVIVWHSAARHRRAGLVTYLNANEPSNCAASEDSGG
jgi:phosphatidylglycerol:prolipoprotein diacylglycerol transferase